MRTKNIILGMVAVAAAFVLTGCYEKYDTPPPLKQWTEDEIAAAGYTIVDIGPIDTEGTLKNLFLKNVGRPEGTIETPTGTYGKAYVVTEKYAIKGKVISNDAYGNFYRNFYIQDESGNGIEIKAGLGSMHSTYPVGSTVFVICEDLALGNYRKNLSLGLAELEGSSYANRYIDIQSLVDHHIRKSEKTTLVKADTLIVNSANIKQYYTETTNSYGDVFYNFKHEMAGRLVRFEGAKCTWGSFGTNKYPTFQHVETVNGKDVYTDVDYNELFALWDAYDAAVAAGQKPDLPPYQCPANLYRKDRAPSWAFQEYNGSTRFYGNVRFVISDSQNGNAEIPIVIRTSGYCRFALDPVPENNDVVDITGIVNLYTSSSGGFATNQVMLNNSSDVRDSD